MAMQTLSTIARAPSHTEQSTARMDATLHQAGLMTIANNRTFSHDQYRRRIIFLLHSIYLFISLFQSLLNQSPITLLQID